jgi:hypothetical protein
MEMGSGYLPMLRREALERHLTMPVPVHPISLGDALALALHVISTPGWSTYHALGRDPQVPRAVWFVALATHRSSGRDCVLEEPDQWPLTRALHVAYLGVSNSEGGWQTAGMRPEDHRPGEDRSPCSHEMRLWDGTCQERRA